MKKVESLPFLGKSKAKRFLLDNGLRLIVVRSTVAPVFSYQTWYNVGSRDEVDGVSGIAHLFEHMMFKETKNLKLGVFDQTMESLGARDLNAFTSTDYTAYVQSLPVSALDTVARLESERMKNLLLTKKQFESEREVVHNERRQRTENNPEGLMFEELLKLAFTVHPYGRPVIGFEEDLNRMTTRDCEEFYGSYYAPNNAVIAVVGDVDPEKVFKTIVKHYGKFASSHIKPANAKMEPIQTEERVKKMSLNIQVEKAYMAYKIPNAEHEDQIPLSVLSSVLSTGRSSRLYRALVDKGITLDAGAGPSAGKDPSLFYFTFSSQAGKKAAEAIAVIDEEILKIQKDFVTDEELERAKNKLRTEFFMGLSTNSSKAHFIGQNELVLGDYRVALEEMEQLKTVKAADVLRVAKEYLIKDKRSVVIGVPLG